MSESVRDTRIADLLDACTPAAPLPTGISDAERADLREDLESHGGVIENGLAHLPFPVEPLNSHLIQARLSPEVAAWLHELQVLRMDPSTNTALMERARGGSVDGVVRTTEFQTAGRGRRGRSWSGLYARNLAVSVGMEFQHPRKLGGWSLAVGVAVARAMEDMGIQGVALKWPNDVWWHGRKMAGILVETMGFGPVQVVSGVGMNVLLPPAARIRIDQPVADATEAAGAPISRNELLSAFLIRIHEAYQAFLSDGLSAVRADWSRFDALAGREVVVSGAQELHGLATGIGPDGDLLVRTVDGVEHEVRSGDVTVRTQ